MLTKESLDRARFEIKDDSKFQAIGYLIYGKYFENQFSVENDIIYTKTTPVVPKEDNTKRYMVDDKFNRFLENSLYYTFYSSYSYYLVIFKENYIVGLTLDVGIRKENVFRLVRNIIVYADKEYHFPDFLNWVQQAELFDNHCNDIPIYRYMVISNGDFSARTFELKSNYDLNISEMFNDDLPDSSISDFISKETCGLALFHGQPGCGKTSYIKNLMYRNRKKDFYILDASLLDNITNSSFITYLFEYAKNSIFILEDCEKLLLNRNTHNNPWIGTLLNLTDGMLGEALSIKFICTFNSDLKSVDKALLREGRLDILYEFKPLVKERSQILCDRLGKECKGEMTLAEIFKSNTTNSNITKPRTKIGF